MTATQLSYRALRDIGCLRPGQKTSTDVLDDCLTCLNDTIDMWLLDRLMVFAIVANPYTLTAGLQTYTIGPAGANLTAPRPTKIEDANIILNTVTPVVRYPLDLLNVDQWAGIAVQDIPSAIPQVLYYDGNYNQPSGFGTINLWPGPLTSYQLELFTWQQIQEFADLTTDYRFPPGYAKALRKTLAVEIAPMMEIYSKLGKLAQPRQSLLQLVIQQAAEAKAAIQSFNAPERIAVCDPAFTGSSRRGAFNYGTGLTGRGMR